MPHSLPFPLPCAPSHPRRAAGLSHRQLIPPALVAAAGASAALSRLPEPRLATTATTSARRALTPPWAPRLTARAHLAPLRLRSETQSSRSRSMEFLVIFHCPVFWFELCARGRLLGGIRTRPPSQRPPLGVLRDTARAMSQENVEIVRNASRRSLGRTWRGVPSYSDPAMVVDVSARVSNPSIYRGQSGVFGSCWPTWRGLGRVPRRAGGFIDAGERIVVIAA